MGGSGVYDLPALENARWERVTSPWGEPSDDLRMGEVDGLPIVFLPRHGRGSYDTATYSIHSLK